VTGREYAARGLTVVMTPRGLEVGRCPRPLRAELARDVRSKYDVVGSGTDFKTRTHRDGCCSHCGDRLHGTASGGTCLLCALARAELTRDLPRRFDLI
jgi:hypothetical protein